MDYVIFMIILPGCVAISYLIFESFKIVLSRGKKGIDKIQEEKSFDTKFAHPLEFNSTNIERRYK